METRANHLWVGLVTLLLLAAMAAAIIWIARLGQGEKNEYDIFYKQSVAGLANGSQVSFAGVPVGQVIDIAVSDPEFVRVRIRVNDDVPILIGTQATIQGSFTGVSAILLDGAVKGQPLISCDTTACPEGRPVIPPGSGGLGELVASAPLILERIATVTERLTEILGDENQEQLEGILRNTNQLSGELAKAAPRLEGTFSELENALREAGEALDAFEKATQSTETLINEEGSSLAEELRGTLASANKAAASLSATLEDTRPAARALRESTLPAAEATLQDLRVTSQSLRSLTERIENEGAGSLLGRPTLPDYEPPKGDE